MTEPLSPREAATEINPPPKPSPERIVQFERRLAWEKAAQALREYGEMLRQSQADELARMRARRIERAAEQDREREEINRQYAAWKRANRV